MGGWSPVSSFRDRVKRYTADVQVDITAGNRTGGPRAAQSVEDMLRSAGLALGRIASALEGTLDTLRSAVCTQQLADRPRMPNL